MFKFNKQQFKRTISNLNHAVRGYHHVKHIANHIDYGASVAKEVYRALEPIILQHGRHDLHGHAMRAISGYDNIKNQAIEANHHITHIGQRLSGLI